MICDAALLTVPGTPINREWSAMTVRDYEIRIRGEFGRRQSIAFEDLNVSVSAGHTLLSGRLPDQAALYGVIRRLEDLGLEIVDIHSAVPRPDAGNSR
jgi:hypothetical protein